MVAHSIQDRREVLEFGQDMPADAFCYPGGKCRGAPAESLSTTEYKPLVADIPRVSDCCVQAHGFLKFCTEGSHQFDLSASCLWYCRMGKVILLGQESVEGQRKLDQPVVSCLVERGTLKAIQCLCCISTGRPRLLKLTDLLLKDFSLKSFIKDLQIIKIATNCH